MTWPPGQTIASFLPVSSCSNCKLCEIVLNARVIADKERLQKLIFGPQDLLQPDRSLSDQ